jgi:hypothetical protein
VGRQSTGLVLGLLDGETVKLTMPSLFAGMPWVRMWKRSWSRPASMLPCGGPLVRSWSSDILFVNAEDDKALRGCGGRWYVDAMTAVSSRDTR